MESCPGPMSKQQYASRRGALQFQGRAGAWVAGKWRPAAGRCQSSNTRPAGERFNFREEPEPGLPGSGDLPRADVKAAIRVPWGRASISGKSQSLGCREMESCPRPMSKQQNLYLYLLNVN
ncbi:hypothetical protein NDU88_005156 [Pleurodeles waltl]|uniref:Uncharacterized protein n=1 Tax=Pleurodeles waltl TaxID=8319 RepID=A0AAV7TTZ6_PLEWA|nr:hypothetical protein NDU88_005156 [Pleurodeles waltl]